MTQPEISEDLSPHQHQLISDYLARTWAAKDGNAKSVWRIAINLHRMPHRVPTVGVMGLTTAIPRSHRIDEPTFLALRDGMGLLARRGYDAGELFEDANPWRAFETLGIKSRSASEPKEVTTRGRYRSAYDEAIRDIAAARSAPHLHNEFYKQVADAVFDTCYEALEHYIAWNNERGPAERASFDELRQTKNRASNTVAPRLHVISAPMGAGKTTFTTAFIMAMVRLSGTHPSLPYGVVFLVDQIVKADGLYRELDRHLPGKVAIWTSDHDADCAEPKQVPTPAARFRKDELRNYPVAIVAHALFQGPTSETARVVLHQDKEVYRALTLVDEQMQEVSTYNVQLSVAEGLREKMQEAGHDTTHIDPLVTFMMQKALTKGSLEKPTSETEGWKVAQDFALAWFATEEARRYAAQYRDRWQTIDQVLGFARCLVNDCAFIARDNRGYAGTHFVGYEPKHAIVPGMVLIDATADVDGVSRLCPWREHAEVPHGRYDNLSIVHIETCADEENLKKYLSTKGNRNAYAEWMRKVVLEELEAGQKALVVCKKALLDHKSFPGPFPRNPAASLSPDDPPYGLDVDGREVGVTYWGGPGLGSNAWQDADVVFLFDEHHLPRRAAIAGTQGHLMAPTSEGILAAMTALNSKSDEVDWIGAGHILRWVRQMALRGRGRVFDERGVCGKQKVVISGGSGSLERLVLHKERLFPGAMLTISRSRDLSRYSNREKLLLALSDPTLNNELPASTVGKFMGVDWGSISGSLMRGDTDQMLMAIGWTYRRGKGRGGSSFSRIKAATVM